MISKPVFVFTVCLFISGCWFSKRTIPLPQNEQEFAAPVQKPLVFSAPVKIRWHVVNPDSIKRGPISSFYMDKLPDRPFNPPGFKALLTPAVQKTFNYNSLPDTILNLDIIPAEPLVFKTSLLNTFKKTTLLQPRIRAESYFTSFQYGMEQGLPGSNVQSTLQTKDGLTWISTDGGLCILNGESLEIFPNRYGAIYSMIEDRLGRVWLMTHDYGVFVIDRKAGIQKHFDLLTSASVRIDKKGFIWLGTFNNGIFLIDPEMTTIKHITTVNGLTSDRCIRTLEDKDGRIWIATIGNGINILDPVAKKIKRLGLMQGLDVEYVFSFAENKSGDIYVGGFKRGVDIVNIRKQTIKHIDSAQGLEKSAIFNLCESDEAQMWLATDSAGVSVLNSSADSIAHIGQQEGLGDNATWWLAKENNGQMIVGTFDGGMNIFPPPNKVAHIFTKKDGLLDNEIWGLLEDNQKRIWIATHSGINIITPAQKILKLLPNPYGTNRSEGLIQTGPDQFYICGFGSGLISINESKHELERIGLREGLPSINTYNIFKDSRGGLWLGTDDGGVILFDPQKRTIRFLNRSSGLSDNRINGVGEDSIGRIWIATQSGVDILDLRADSIYNLSKKGGLSDDQDDLIFKDEKNRMWIATENGLNSIDPIRKTNTIFSFSSGLGANGIYSLLENKGQIYAGTANGLTVLSEKENPDSKATVWRLQTFGQAQGMPYLNFNGNTSLATSSGQQWWGILPTLTTLDESVLQPDSITVPPRVVGIDVLGSPISFSDPGTIQNVDTLWNSYSDTFYLKGSFSALNTDRKKGIEWDSLSDSYIPVNLSMPPDQNYLRFHFGNPRSQNEGEYKYRYILDGVDEKWSPVTTQSVTENYNNISPGYYTFRVAAQKNLGPWSEPSIYHFRIRPPWWFSWWAELVYLLIFVGVVRLWVRYRSRRLLKENALLEQKVTDRTTALSTSLENLRQTQSQLIQAEKMASLGELTAGIAHEIQNPLNFVNNFSEVNTELLEDVNKALDEGDIPEAKDILNDIEMNMSKITFHGKRADAIVKGMLLHSRASSGQKIPTDVNALADEYLRLSYHGLRAKDKSFNALFNTDFDEGIGQIMLVQQDIGRVLLNIFNNAFYSVTEKKKTSPESYQPVVSVSTKKKGDKVEIRIRDNGQGIPKKVVDKIFQPFFTTKPAGQGTGLGLSLSYDIVTKEHSGRIDLTTKENEFTEFVIELPVQSAT